MQIVSKGLLCAIEGIDGSGKTTLARNLHAYAQEQQVSSLLTREPGSTSLGSCIRSLVQEKTVPICPRAEYLLFAADRAQHFHEIVIPALYSGKLVISDRMADSSLVYQGYGRGLDRSLIDTVNQWTMQGIWPDVTVYVRVHPAVAYERIEKRQEKKSMFDQEKKDFFMRLVQGFDTLYEGRTDCIIVDGTLDQDTITRYVWEQIKKWMEKKD